MTQVFTNLLSNAVKYTPSRGRIEIAVDDDSKEVRVSVKDSGNGIPTAHLDGIFGLFSQLDTGKERLKSGLGIGLTLVRSLVEMHGGTVRAESDGEGLGSVFTVTIPLTSASSEDGEMAPKQEASHELRGCRVLVVDDNKAISKMLEMSMTLLGNEVRVAGDGQEAFQIASQFLPQLILMDIGMPRMNGLEAAKLIKQQEWGRSMTLVALSGWGQERDRRQAFEAGFDHHLVKPAKQSDLKRILIEVASKSK